MTATEACAPLTTYCIDFIDEDDTRGILLGLLEEVPYPGGTNTHKHFYEVRTRNSEEWNTRFPCYSLSQEGFPRPRRACQKNPLRNLSTHFSELIWILEEFYNLFQFFLGFFLACYVLEVYLHRIIHHFSPAFAEVHHLATAPLGLLHDKEPNGDENDHRHDRCE